MGTLTRLGGYADGACGRATQTDERRASADAGGLHYLYPADPLLSPSRRPVMVSSSVNKMHSGAKLAVAPGRPSTSERVGKRESIAREPPISRPQSDRSQAARVSRNLRRAGRLLAWSALMAIAIVFAVVVQGLAANALVTPGTTEPPAACRAALTAGDHVRESFLAHSCDRAFGATSKP
jgi:hypothetical protein